jgi:hypothetical protein
MKDKGKILNALGRKTSDHIQIKIIRLTLGFSIILNITQLIIFSKY